MARDDTPAWTVEGAELSLVAQRVEIPLFSAGAPAAEGGSVPPRVGAPELKGELELRPVRDLALREILSHAESGRATVRLPLPARTFKVGPFSLEIPAGTQAVIELEVERAAIVRESVRGTLEPPIALPLGISFRGLYLDDAGCIIADIASFPDVNLSKLSERVPRIPGTLDELLSLLFDREERPEGEEAREGFDATGLQVSARDVVPRAEVFHLGDAGDVLVGEDTRLDVDFAEDELSVRGRLDMRRATLHGAGFYVDGVRGEGTLTFRVHGLGGVR